MTQERTNTWATCHQLYISEAGRPARAIALARTMTIGRDDENDIVLDSITVSRCHAVLLRDDTGVRLIDLESTNGTSVNGVPVPSDQPVTLNNGTIIELGQVKARYYEPANSNSYTDAHKQELRAAHHRFEPYSLDDGRQTMDDARPAIVHRPSSQAGPLLRSDALRKNIELTHITPDRECAAILRPAGALDWSTYADLIAQAWAARMGGARYLIVDLHDVERIATAGLVGLYAVARLAQGAPPPDLEAGWAAIRALAEEQPLTAPLAVARPRVAVRQAIASRPFSDFIALHDDLATALDALAPTEAC